MGGKWQPCVSRSTRLSQIFRSVRIPEAGSAEVKELPAGTAEAKLLNQKHPKARDDQSRYMPTSEIFALEFRLFEVLCKLKHCGSRLRHIIRAVIPRCKANVYAA